MNPPGSGEATPADVLLLGNYRQTLVVARSLARAGYGVTVVNDRGDGKRDFLEFSRSVSGVWKQPQCPDGASFADALVAYLKGAGRGVKYVFPVGEISLKQLAENAARFANLATLIMPKAETVLMCLDKRRMHGKALALGIPVPPWSEGVDRDQWRSKALEYGLPVVFKRKDSFSLVQDKKALIVRTENALDAFLSTLGEDPDPASLLMEKYISGVRHNCYIAAVDGTITAILEVRIIRTDMLDETGYAVDAATVPIDENLKRHCRTLLADLRYTGVCTIQFLLDPASSAPWFLEINPRLGAFAALPAFAGYDFPKMALDCARYSGQGPLPGSTTGPAYLVDMRAYWLYGDIVALLGHLRRIPLRESLRWAGSVVGAICTHRRHVTWRFDDPMPTLYLYYDFAARLGRGMIRRLARAMGFSG